MLSDSERGDFEAKGFFLRKGFASAKSRKAMVEDVVALCRAAGERASRTAPS